MDQITDIDMRQWLLRLADPSSSGPWEERLLLDDALAERLREAEYDLIDDYAGNRLTPAERAAFERHLLATAEDRHRLRVAQALAAIRSVGHLAHTQLVSPETTPVQMSARSHLNVPKTAVQRVSVSTRQRVRVWGTAIAACLLVAAAVVVLRVSVFQRAILPEAPQADLAGLPTISLLAATQRGMDVSAIELPAHADRIRLQLEVEPSASPRRFTLSIADDERVLFNAAGLYAHATGNYWFVEAAVPTQALGPGVRHVSLAAEGTGTGAAAHWIVRTRLESSSTARSR